MGRWAFIIIFALLAAKAPAADVDTFAGLEWAEPEAGQQIRLLAVHPHDLPAAEGYRYLVPNENNVTRYGALLAHVMRTDGAWLQERLVGAGRAVVMPVYETDTGRLALLKDAERQARENRAGVWAGEADFLHCADDARGAFDGFALVQGRLVDAARVRGTVYLNFGEDWRRDFTVKITNRTFRKLPAAMQKALDDLIESDNPEAVIEARGWVHFEGGPMIEITHAAQLDFHGPASPFIKGGCL